MVVVVNKEEQAQSQQNAQASLARLPRLVASNLDWLLSIYLDWLLAS